MRCFVNSKKNGIWQDNFIEEEMKAAYGFSDHQLEQEMDAAMAEADCFPEQEVPKDEFQRIMEKLEIAETKDSGLPDAVPPVKRISRKRMYRMLIAAALLGTLCVGLAGSAVGRGAFQYTDFQASDKEGNIVWNNVRINENVSTVEKAYEKIEEELGIPALRLNYIPAGMLFIGLETGNNRAIIKFNYNDNIVRLTEVKEDRNVAGIHTSDREEYNTYHNKFIKETIILSRNMLDDGIVEWGAEISTETAYYYLSGIMEEEEFNQIIQMMYFE